MHKTSDGGTYKIPVSTGLFEHRGRIKDALWLFLWYIDRTTREDNTPDGSRVGIVLGGRPIRDSDVARTFKVNKRTIRRWRSRLNREGYIQQVRTPAGYAVGVLNSKKWAAGYNPSDRPKMAAHAHSDGTSLSGSEVPNVSAPIRQYRTLQKTTHNPPSPPLRGARGISPLAGNQAEGFVEFWRVYPRRVSKPAAVRAWRSLSVDETLLAAILAGIERYKRSEQWRRDGGRYIPHPATFLNQRRWEDELGPAQAAEISDDAGLDIPLARLPY